MNHVLGCLLAVSCCLLLSGLARAAAGVYRPGAAGAPSSVPAAAGRAPVSPEVVVPPPPSEPAPSVLPDIDITRIFSPVGLGRAAALQRELSADQPQLAQINLQDPVQRSWLAPMLAIVEEYRGEIPAAELHQYAFTGARARIIATALELQRAGATAQEPAELERCLRAMDALSEPLRLYATPGLRDQFTHSTLVTRSRLIETSLNAYSYR